MYLHNVEIKDIRSISHLELSFKKGKEAGWHVLIGDNGTGKSTILRAISLGIIGPNDAKALRLVLNEWIKHGKESGTVALKIKRDSDWDSYSTNRRPRVRPFNATLKITRIAESRRADFEDVDSNEVAKIHVWSNRPGWFSAAFGPMRRFTGGNKDWQKLYYSDPRVAAHLSVFGEDVALSEALDWLTDLDRRRLKEQEAKMKNAVKEPEVNYQGEADTIFGFLKKFINESKLLPHNAQFSRIDLDGEPVFVDGNQNEIKVTELSDGYRSILSMIFELIRQLITVYEAEYVFEDIAKGGMYITLPGVVLIDEVDAHLHPTWQTRIGQWFTRYFPNLQFIVTTHSPLICRGCIDDDGKINGSIWQLAKPGTNQNAEKLQGTKLNRLVFGNILDAYDTEAFGENVTSSKMTTQLHERIASLNKKSFKGTISEAEKEELFELRKTLPTGS